MSTAAHIDALVKKHATLDTQVVKLQVAAATPDAEIAALKRRKLAVKDEIVRLVGAA